MADIVFSVSQINEYISKKMFRDPFLSAIAVVGEVTNFSLSSVGHAFFSLKDEDSMISCIVYEYADNEYKDAIIDGALIKVSGRIIFYKKSASVQLAVEKASAEGIGDLYAKFEQTKQKLFAEGLFDKAYKKAIPDYPLNIGVVTSASGAAVHDIINVATRRFEGISITVYPAQVQGKDAARQITGGIKYFNDKKSVDVIIVGRGGGSFEDLFAFNEESVARAVFESEIPIVSAVGHETDFSLCDMAADLRAPTPSAAAELVVRSKQDIIDYIRAQKQRLFENLADALHQRQLLADMLTGSIKAFPLSMKLEQAGERITASCRMIKTSLIGLLEKNTLLLGNQINNLNSLNPQNVLKRGFAIVYDENNNVITSSKKSRENMDIEFADGRVSVTRKD